MPGRKRQFLFAGVLSLAVSLAVSLIALTDRPRLTVVFALWILAAFVAGVTVGLLLARRKES
jgi:hypothetical protein